MKISLRSALVVAVAVAIGACTTTGTDTPVAVGGPDVSFADGDFEGMIDASSAPDGLAFADYWVYADVEVLAATSLDWFSPDAFTPKECAANPLFVELLSPADGGAETTGSVHYWVEYGVEFAGVWTEAALVQARTFDSPDAAAAFLAEGLARSEQCLDGYVFEPTPGEVYEISSVTVSRDRPGYPEDVTAAGVEIDAGDAWGVGRFAFVQYGNVLAVVAVTDSQEIVQPPGRVDEIGVLIAQALVDLGESLA